MRAALERGLEEGAFAARLPTFASRPWERLAGRGLARPLLVPESASALAIGGATLGGSWKTPLALACTRLLARSRRVVLLGHAYRARPGHGRFVVVEDDVRVVGDEALACARELAGEWGAEDPERPRVAVGPTRQAALDFAVAHADHVVLDGALQLLPRRARLSLLAVDAAAPWGAGACPPRGDLRAPVDALLAVCDRLVAVGGSMHASLEHLPLPVHHARPVVRGVEAVRGLRVGVWTAIARPSRLKHALGQLGVRPLVFLTGGDHAPPSRHALSCARAARVDVWLCTTKCYEHVGAELAGRPVLPIRLDLELDPGLASLVVALTGLGHRHSLRQGRSGVREAHA